MGEVIDSSPQFVLDCVPDGGSCNGGNQYRAMTYLHDFKVPVPLEKDYPYQGVDQGCRTGVPANKIVTEYIVYDWGCDNLTKWL